jgi:2-oxoglutarate ferredoxin oxidoreductase subunit delta
VLVLSKRFNRKGYHPPEVVIAEDCVNCHLCEMICPDFAIFSLEITDDETGSEARAAESLGSNL